MFRQWICQKTKLLPPDDVRFVRHFSELNISCLRALTQSLSRHLPPPSISHSLPYDLSLTLPFFLPSLLVSSSQPDYLLFSGLPPPLFLAQTISPAFSYVSLLCYSGWEEAGRSLVINSLWEIHAFAMLFSIGLTPGPFTVVLQISLVVSASQLRLAIELVHPSAVLNSTLFSESVYTVK